MTAATHAILDEWGVADGGIDKITINAASNG